jgi:endonuclease/exonuclease/phosphatase (EEP) superfamily protein YafD
LRILLANVHTANRQHELVLNLIAREDADILVLQEVNSRWLEALAPLETEYPHHVEKAREDNFGIAVFSRIPIEDLRVEYIGGARVPTAIGRLSLGESSATLIATHPVPPVGGEMFDWRNEQLREIAQLAATQPLSVIIGDLNTTPWSPIYQEFERTSGLCNTRRGAGILPTWPAGLGALGIPLDHCLVSEEIEVTGIRTGARTGSDHLPLLVDLLFP